MGRDTFYRLLASLRGQLFRDADFAEFLCLDNGRASVLPSPQMRVPVERIEATVISSTGLGPCRLSPSH